MVGDEVHGGIALVKARRPGAHFSAFDERGEKLFAVERATDRATEHDADLVRVMRQIDFGRSQGFAGGEPAEFVATRTVQGCAKSNQVILDFTDGNLAVAG